ncbi:putative alpha-1,3-mannosyl-glycoprotein 2-beta-N-acetylglucosaminyltransferase [Aphelenchoides bicaudatus]|nr:putative alpha-1,3-mannosyl-glycoprotein 2-beta-N-acetylglucosaminyltransferase [Aphelenchoides bicaudatus]
MKQLQRVLFVLVLVVFALFAFYTYNVDNEKDFSPNTSDLIKRVKHLEELVEVENKRIDNIQEVYQKVIRPNRLLHKENSIDTVSQLSNNTCSKPIAVLIFVCDRAAAIKSQLNKLLKYRKSKELFPIIVSQDCDNQSVVNVVKSFGPDVEYIKHESGEHAHVTASPGRGIYKTYYLISRHYKLGLSYVFDKRNFDSVIIVEDDLDISEDFFEYFCGTRWLLDADPSLFCVSAWNDNGRASLIDLTGHQKLYRSDFFPGLGWLMTNKLWQEVGPNWPTGFWDDWIRDPLRRKGRSCIRPEISRTAMTLAGQKGASKGLFFNYYLKKILLNNVPVQFTTMDLSYLLKSNYDPKFIKEVYELPLISIDDFLKLSGKGSTLRIEYKSMPEYTTIAKRLRIMADTKAGVQRTAYKGVVSCFTKGNRVYLAPKNPSTWKYDPAWEAPSDVLNPIDRENNEK